MRTVEMADYTHQKFTKASDDKTDKKFQIQQLKKEIQISPNIEGAHLQCVCNHCAKF